MYYARTLQGVSTLGVLEKQISGSFESEVRLSRKRNLISGVMQFGLQGASCRGKLMCFELKEVQVL